MKASPAELLKLLPGPVSERWPQGERFVRALSHGSMTAEVYAPKGEDPQQPHEQDELYVIISGSGTLTIAGERFPCAHGDMLFVPARTEHRFVDFSSDFVTLAIFWGPPGGEKG